MENETSSGQQDLESTQSYFASKLRQPIEILLRVLQIRFGSSKRDDFLKLDLRCLTRSSLRLFLRLCMFPPPLNLGCNFCAHLKGYSKKNKKSRRDFGSDRQFAYEVACVATHF